MWHCYAWQDLTPGACSALGRRQPGWSEMKILEAGNTINAMKYTNKQATQWPKNTLEGDRRLESTQLQASLEHAAGLKGMPRVQVITRYSCCSGKPPMSYGATTGRLATQVASALTASLSSAWRSMRSSHVFWTLRCWRALPKC